MASPAVDSIGVNTGGSSLTVDSQTNTKRVKVSEHGNKIQRHHYDIGTNTKLKSL